MESNTPSFSEIKITSFQLSFMYCTFLAFAKCTAIIPCGEKCGLYYRLQLLRMSSLDLRSSSSSESTSVPARARKRRGGIALAFATPDIMSRAQFASTIQSRLRTLVKLCCDRILLEAVCRTRLLSAAGDGS